MIKSLRRASCSHIQENYFLFDYYDDVLFDIGKKLNIDFGKKCIRLGEIKEILGGVKKRQISLQSPDRNKQPINH